MSFRLVDLKCPRCGEILMDKMCRHDSTLPCPVCATEMTVWWGAGKMMRDRKSDAFVPVVAGFKTYSTRDEWNNYLKTMRRQTGNPDFDVEGQTRRGRRQAIEEHIEDTINDYREHGMDYTAAQRRLEHIVARGRR